MISLKNVSFAYKKNSPVIENLSLDIDKGEVSIILGENGIGKSTLFKLILGLEKLNEGSIELDGESLLKMKKNIKAKRIAYVPQNIEFGSLSVFETVLLGRLSSFIISPSTEDKDITKNILSSLGLSEYLNRNVNELSGGEKQKVAIARALVSSPEYIVFDEPTGNLDIKNERLIIDEAVKLAKEKSIGVILSTHDLALALNNADKIIFLKEDKTIEIVKNDEVTPQLIKDTFAVDVLIRKIDGRYVIL